MINRRVIASQKRNSTILPRLVMPSLSRKYPLIIDVETVTGVRFEMMNLYHKI